ncbi:TetR/AcrR family transcriptional regulator [Nocardia puris]|uniref:TetR family transcriptional regulator n=1 Tax=Nocardia puris TaxID=208602 RepID=A0A366DWQ7_9NOCA|nr:TetR/AcrR family transcriptional regulator [Nocardia puris]MBF6210182.1 TetR/AcrR family transcriptional regulator [Nocardia puris]MBF6367259.1 TetR/AcrR family transcriptional regulator [Nocardia puris]MBF6457443.1 TetR/AcrR family transcriptional regulator [Nocardia puris]RBO93598.1 TetR family transcriptional regulator [Nocardia puris]
MPRARNPEIRALLLERAAAMLRRREAVTLRGLVAGTTVSTMAVYTYFDGMDGLWKALRQEGFVRLSAKLSEVPETADPVRDLAALGAAYLDNALENPDLYRVMFDAGFELEDTAAADASLHKLVVAVGRATAAGRFREDVDALELATQTWVVGHGLASLTATGPLPHEALGLAVPMLTALFVAAGDDPECSRASVESGWVLGATADAHPPGG